MNKINVNDGDLFNNDNPTFLNIESSVYHKASKVANSKKVPIFLRNIAFSLMYLADCGSHAHYLHIAHVNAIYDAFISKKMDMNKFLSSDFNKNIKYV